jgi:hypothetical protein
VRGASGCLRQPCILAGGRLRRALAACHGTCSANQHTPWGRNELPGSRFAPKHTTPPETTIEEAMTTARITGKVEYREGDGARITIRPGPIEVEETALDVTISWTDGDSRGSAAIPIADYRRYVATKAIQIDGRKAAR